jgi:hypothetical protein
MPWISAVPLHRQHLVQPFLKLRDLIAVPAVADDDDEPLPRTAMPPLGHYIQAHQQPTNILIRLSHRSDGLFLTIGGIVTYPIVAQPMPQKSRRKIGGWKRYLIRDSLGHLVFDLYQTIDGGHIGSRWELAARGVHIYSSRDLKSDQREERRLSKIFAAFPGRRGDVLNLRNSVAKLLTKPYRPYHLSKRRWMTTILRARHHLQGEELETRVTIALEDYNNRPANRSKHRPHFYRSLSVFNSFRQEILDDEQSMSEEPPIIDMRYWRN